MVTYYHLEMESGPQSSFLTLFTSLPPDSFQLFFPCEDHRTPNFLLPFAPRVKATPGIAQYFSLTPASLATFFLKSSPGASCIPVQSNLIQTV